MMSNSFLLLLNSLQISKYYVQVYLYKSSNISSTYLSILPPPITNIKITPPKKTYITNTKKIMFPNFPKQITHLFSQPQKHQSLRDARAGKW